MLSLSVLFSLIVNMAAANDVSLELQTEAENHLLLTEAEAAYRETSKLVQQAFLEKEREIGDSEQFGEEYSAAVIRQREEFLELINDEFSWQVFKPMMIDVLVKTYTLEDLVAINKFYSSDAGRSFITKAPELAKATFELNKQRSKKVFSQVYEMQARHQKELNAINRDN